MAGTDYSGLIGPEFADPKVREAMSAMIDAGWIHDRTQIRQVIHNLEKADLRTTATAKAPNGAQITPAAMHETARIMRQLFGIDD